MNALFALVHARNIEFLRDKAALSWSLLFPLILTLAIAFLFQNNDSAVYKVGVLGKPTADQVLKDLNYIQFIPYQDSVKAHSLISRHKLDLLLTIDGYAINPDNKKGYFLEQLILARAPFLKKFQIAGRNYSHVEWYLPGILGMNIMFSSLYGVGYIVIRYRRTGVLKRMQVTPLNQWHFLGSQLLSRLITTVFSSALIFLVIATLFGIRVEGSILLLLISTLFGTTAMISIGLMVASRTRSDELGNGLLNFVSWPMMFLSDIWFSTEGSPNWIVRLADCLPLTHMNNINRAIISSGASFSEIATELGILAAISMVCFLIAQHQFKWE